VSSYAVRPRQKGRGYTIRVCISVDPEDKMWVDAHPKLGGCTSIFRARIRELRKAERERLEGTITDEEIAMFLRERRAEAAAREEAKAILSAEAAEPLDSLGRPIHPTPPPSGALQLKPPRLE
jgi:hypothetical protein